MLSLSKDRQLSALRSLDGRSRLEIEAKIKDIKNEIFRIEEDTLEPAQERIRLITVEKDAAIASLEAQIRKWDMLSARVTESKLKLTPEEMSAMEYQAGLIADMLETGTR